MQSIILFGTTAPVAKFLLDKIHPLLFHFLEGFSGLFDFFQVHKQVA
ncbi:hypothetical protein [Legionella qingyii]|nr:hypothetical protein [Legionella qingyii]